MQKSDRDQHMAEVLAFKCAHAVPDACLIASLKAMLRFFGGTWVETWIAEAEKAAREGKVVRYDK